MKSYLKPVFVIFLTFVFTVMTAQIKAGYIFGVNLSTITMNTKGLTSGPETPVSVHFGGSCEIPVTGNFTFDPGLLLSAKGSDYTIDTVEFSLSPIYLEIPVIAMYSFGSDEIKISLFAGPYFACGLGGYKIDQGGELQNISFGSSKNDDLKTFDFGFNFGAGINIKGLLISAQYGIGLVNISTEATPDSEMKNKVIGISISSLFAGK
jgi:hypothetical protein